MVVKPLAMLRRSVSIEDKQSSISINQPLLFKVRLRIEDNFKNSHNLVLLTDFASTNKSATTLQG